MLLGGQTRNKRLEIGYTDVETAMPANHSVPGVAPREHNQQTDSSNTGPIRGRAATAMQNNALVHVARPSRFRLYAHDSTKEARRDDNTGLLLSTGRGGNARVVCLKKKKKKKRRQTFYRRTGGRRGKDKSCTKEVKRKSLVSVQEAPPRRMRNGEWWCLRWFFARNWKTETSRRRRYKDRGWLVGGLSRPARFGLLCLARNLTQQKKEVWARDDAEAEPLAVKERSLHFLGLGPGPGQLPGSLSGLGFGTVHSTYSVGEQNAQKFRVPVGG